MWPGVLVHDRAFLCFSTKGKVRVMLNPVPPKMQAVPAGFEHYRQFINWRLVPDHDKPGKNKKLPCDLYGNVINSHDPKYWLSAEEASRSEHGIAFVFSDRDPFWFLDLDHAWNGFDWSELAKYCLSFFPGCAVEVSHSGHGLHLFGYGSHVLPVDHGCKNTAIGLELYTTGRFVALTGTSRTGSAWINFADRLPLFVSYANLKPREAPEAVEASDGPDPRYTGPADDATLLSMMLGSVGSVRSLFGTKAHPRDLWEANTDALKLHFPQAGRADGAGFDWSAADASLMSHLSFWTGRDTGRMVSLFEQSRLYRPDKYAGRGAYRVGLLVKQGLRNPGVYDKPSPSAAVAPIAPSQLAPDAVSAGKPAARGARSTMELAKQIEHFAGCVYVEASHSVMVPSGRLMTPTRFNAVYGGFSFQMQYDNGKPTTEAFRAFTENRMYAFPKVVDTCFRPDRAPCEIIDERINTWRTPVVDEAPGDITPFLNHVAKLVPNSNDRRILFAYMQSLARNHGVKFQWAPVIQGVQGNGKSLLLRVLYHAVTKAYSHLPKASQITEKYNSWIERRLFIGVEEIKVTDRREVLEDLKDAVTNDWVEVRGMQQEKRMTDNFTNWIFCTNYKDAIPVNRDERRYAIFYTAQQSVDDLKRDGMDEAYFKRIYEWLKKEGGYQAIAYWLRHAPIEATEYDPAGLCQRAPVTSSTIEAITVSLGRVEQEILEAVEINQPGFRDDWISTGALTKFLKDRGVRDLSSRKMGEILKSLGYVKLFRSSRRIAEEEGQQPNIYRRNGRNGTMVDFCAAQDYQKTLTSIAIGH
jgi:hypothetical protein